MTAAAVRERVEDWAQAIRTRDIEAVLSLYAPDIVSFDVNPPLRYAGADNKRRAWEKFFTVHAGPLTYEPCEVDITTEGDLAFVHSLNHVSSTLAGGRNSEIWVRWTACFRRIGGTWLVLHDHVSIPADPQHASPRSDSTALKTPNPDAV